LFKSGQLIGQERTPRVRGFLLSDWFSIVLKSWHLAGLVVGIPGDARVIEKQNQKHLKNNFMYTTINFRQTISNVSKKAAVMMTLLLVLGTSYSFAKPADSADGDIRISFKKSFRGAELMSTEAHAAFTKVTFKMNDAVMFAFYSNKGELLAVTRNITSSQLPVGLMLSLKSDYKAYWITELFEFTGDDNSCYYVSLESADAKVTLRSNVDSWEVYTTEKK